MIRRSAAVAAVAGALLALPAAVAADTAFESAVQHARGFAAARVSATETGTPAGSFPSETTGSNAWELEAPSDWRSGMLPGGEWSLYQLTGDPAWRGLAQTRQAPIAAEKNDTTTSDLGFMLFNTFGRDYQLTADASARKVALKAAA